MGEIKLLRPVANEFPLTAPFGHNTGPHKGKPHKGTDFGCPVGTPVRAAASGRVVKAAKAAEPDDPAHPEKGPSKLGARVWLWVEAPGYTARMGYCHLNSFCVKVGDKVQEGDVIGRSGNTGNSTGPHLHFQVNVYPGDVPSAVQFYSEM